MCSPTEGATKDDVLYRFEMKMCSKSFFPVLVAKSASLKNLKLVKNTVAKNSYFTPWFFFKGTPTTIIWYTNYVPKFEKKKQDKTQESEEVIRF